MLPLLPDHGHDVSHIPGAAREHHEHAELLEQVSRLEQRVYELEQLVANLRSAVER